jgi:hypothetical protein
MERRRPLWADTPRTIKRPADPSTSVNAVLRLVLVLVFIAFAALMGVDCALRGSC